MTVTWRKSSHSFSNGNCAEVAAWQKSSHSTFNGSCAEIRGGAAVSVRDSRDPAGPVLAFSPGQWERFTAALKDAAGPG